MGPHYQNLQVQLEGGGVAYTILPSVVSGLSGADDGNHAIKPLRAWIKMQVNINVQ